MHPPLVSHLLQVHCLHLIHRQAAPNSTSHFKSPSPQGGPQIHLAGGCVGKLIMFPEKPKTSTMLFPFLSHKKDHLLFNKTAQRLWHLYSGTHIEIRKPSQLS